MAAFRFLPVLDNLKLATPCDQAWEGMVGNERVRHCGSCRKNVFNLSALTRDAATQLVRETEGDLCVRFFKRSDGTILTSDCSVGVRRTKRNVLIAAGAVVTLAVGAYGAFRMTRSHEPEEHMTEYLGGAPMPEPVSVERVAPPPPPAREFARPVHDSQGHTGMEPLQPPEAHVVTEHKGGVGFRRD